MSINCNTCLHEDTCKYKENAKEYEDRLLGNMLSISNGLPWIVNPIIVDVNCKYHIEKDIPINRLGKGGIQ
jgi:hypothetical protein